MTTYLHVGSGAYRFLVDIAQVAEVGDAVRLADAAGRRAWREHNLPVVDLAAVVGAAREGDGQQVILLDAYTRRPAIALDVDRVLDLVEVEDSRLRPLAGLSGEIDALVDAACVDSSGRCLLRLRPGAHWPGLDAPREETA